MARNLSQLLARAFVRSRDQRGATLVVIAASMLAMLSFAALAIDYGMLTSARTEAQRAADAAALAGAGVLVVQPDKAAEAANEAIQLAAMNEVRDDPVVLLEQDVQVDLAEATVAVTVVRTAERGSPVGTFFARIFGVDAADIRAYAKAEAAVVPTEYEVDCLLPLAIPDRWREVNDDDDGDGWPELDDTFDPAEGDHYVSGPAPEGTGYSDEDIGKQIMIHKNGGGGGEFTPSWYFPWTPAGEDALCEAGDTACENGPGGDRYRDRFTGCIYGSFAPGTVVQTEPGAMVGPTRQGFEALYDLDPTAFWHEDWGCVTRPGAFVSSDGTACVFDSPRVRAAPMWEPSVPPENGRSEFTITNFAAIFVDCEGGPPCHQGQYFTAHFLGLTGYAAEEGGEGEEEGTPGPIVKRVRLIE